MDNTKIVKRVVLKVLVIMLSIFFCVILFYLGKKQYDEIFKKQSNISYYQSRIASEIKRINSLIESVQKTPQDLAYILEFHDIDLSEMKILLGSVLFNNEELFGSAIAFEPNIFNKDSLYYAPYLFRTGDTTTFTFLNDPAYNYLYKDWYLIPKTLMKPTWSEPYFDEGGGNQLMSTYSVPFYKFNGYKEKFSGIVTVDVAIEWLTKAITTVGKELHGSAILISENGTIIAAPNENWIYNETIFTLASELNLPILREIGRDLQIGQSGLKMNDEAEKDKSSVIFYAPIKVNKWGFILILPKDELYKFRVNNKKRHS